MKSNSISNQNDQLAQASARIRSALGAPAICILLVLCLSSCAVRQAPPAVVEPQSADQQIQTSKTPDPELAAENERLAAQLRKFEEDFAVLRRENERKLQQLERTIILLEMNLASLRQQGRTGRAEPPDARLNPDETEDLGARADAGETHTAAESTTDRSETVGVFKEIETPDSSKAIKTVTVLPRAVPPSVAALSPEPVRPVSSENATPDATSDRPTIEPVSPQPTSPPIVAATPSQPTPPPFEDPDLDPPVSPIILSVVPGAKKHYQEAFKSFSRREYENAIKAFEAFLTRYPNDQDADNAAFWIGQSYYDMKNYLQAEQMFRRVLKQYRHGDTKMGYKTPDAILMLGRIYLLRQQPIRARYYFQQVVDRYDDSLSAAKARREIQSLDSF
jgi:tol-pal system protein YbgF